MATLFRNVRLTPEAYALLARPVVGQGGYQDRLRRLQKAMNVEPDATMVSRSPSTVAIPDSWEPGNVAANVREVAAEPRPQTRIVPGKIAEAIRQEVEEAEANLNRLQSMLQATGIAMPQTTTAPKASAYDPDVDDDPTTDEETLDVSDLDAVMRKAKRAKAEKAALAMVGRKRKSPKLTVKGKAGRTFRMLQLHHGKSPKVAARMREQFGADWKKLIK